MIFHCFRGWQSCSGWASRSGFEVTEGIGFHIYSRSNLCSFPFLFFWPPATQTHSKPRTRLIEDFAIWLNLIPPYRVSALCPQELPEPIPSYLSNPGQTPPGSGAHSTMLLYINLFYRNYYTVFSLPVGYFPNCEFLSSFSAFCSTQNTLKQRSSLAPYVCIRHYFRFGDIINGIKDLNSCSQKS